MKINIISASVDSLNISKQGNVQGDELLARFWVDALQDHPKVTEVGLNSPGEFDVGISFSVNLAPFKGLKILYMQNVFPKPAWPGTEEVFHQVKKHFDEYIFTSDKLRDKCEDGLVVPFCTNKKVYYPREYDKQLDYDACFVGNKIRDDETNDKFIYALKDLNLGLFGNPEGWKSPMCKGKIGFEEEATLYSSSKSSINMTLREHLENGCINFRIYNALACKGFVITDYMEELEEFKDCVVFSFGGDDLVEKVKYYKENQEETQKYREAGYKRVMENHDATHRAALLVDWLEKKL